MPQSNKDEVRINEYIEAEAQQCIICKSKRISAECFNPPTMTSISQNIECMDCESTWTDIYYLSTVKDIEIG